MSPERRSEPFLLEEGPARVEVDPARGGRIARLEVEGLSLLVGEREEPLAWGCYPMAPFAGRVRRGRFRYAGRTHRLPIDLPPHAIHGTTWKRPWQRTGEARWEIDLGPDWPFPGRAVQELELGRGFLALALRVESEVEPFPASLGYHPWFPRRLGRGGEARLSFRPGAMYRRDADGIPDGTLVEAPPGPWDDCFAGVAEAPELHWPGALRLRLESPTDHWVVYDEPSHALCVEPLTGPPDALNLAPRAVEPGAPLSLELRLGWEPDPPS